MTFTLKAIIDLNALLYNVQVIRAKTAAKIYAVVKANAYGHGMSIASYLQHYVDGFCVASASEARELVGLAVYKPILILGEVGENNPILPYDNLVYTVGSLAEAKLFADKKDVGFYIKLNTGMNRRGCDGDAFRNIMNYVRQNSLNCKGVYTHFFQPENEMMTQKQFSLFEEQTCGIELFGGKLHCCASNVLNNDFCRHKDIVRVGLALYGYGGVEAGLRPIMSVCAPIVKIRNLKKGEYVSYGDFKVKSDCKIAVLRIGYGDGYRRLDASRRFVSINGKRCPIVGQICMDMCMADISDVSAEVGDFAYVLGRGISAEELAEEYGTIVYEVLTSFNERVERVYVKR